MRSGPGVPKRKGRVFSGASAVRLLGCSRRRLIGASTDDRSGSQRFRHRKAIGLAGRAFLGYHAVTTPGAISSSRACAGAAASYNRHILGIQRKALSRRLSVSRFILAVVSKRLSVLLAPLTTGASQDWDIRHLFSTASGPRNGRELPRAAALEIPTRLRRHGAAGQPTIARADAVLRAASAPGNGARAAAPDHLLCCPRVCWCLSPFSARRRQG